MQPFSSVFDKLSLRNVFEFFRESFYEKSNMAEGAALEEVLSISHVNEIKQAFEEMAKGEEVISSEMVGEVMKRCGEEVPPYKLRQISEELKLETGGTVNFPHFLKLFKSLSLKTVGGSYKKAIDKRQGVEEFGLSSTSAEGTKHSGVTDEIMAFAGWINACLEDDPDLIEGQ